MNACHLVLKNKSFSAPIVVLKGARNAAAASLHQRWPVPLRIRLRVALEPWCRGDDVGFDWQSDTRPENAASSIELAQKTVAVAHFLLII